LLIEKCAYNSSTLFYPVPFNPFVILCYSILTAHFTESLSLYIMKVSGGNGYEKQELLHKFE